MPTPGRIYAAQDKLTRPKGSSSTGEDDRRSGERAGKAPRAGEGSCKQRGSRQDLPDNEQKEEAERFVREEGFR